MKFIQARNYTKGPRTGPINVLVIHTMESPEKPDTAEAIAKWFAGSSAPQASAHFCIDNNSIVQCVHDDDIAWAAPKKNHDGLHFEHAGRAAQSHPQWDDVYSVAELRISAKLVAAKAKKYHIPVRRLLPTEVAAGKKGICGHVDVTDAFPGSGSHTDPGPNFPWGRYLRYVKTYFAGGTPVDFTKGEL